MEGRTRIERSDRAQVVPYDGGIAFMCGYRAVSASDPDEPKSYGVLRLLVRDGAVTSS